MNCFVHESAIVDEGAKLGENTKVWHFSHIMPRAEIGPDCSLGQNVYVGNDVSIGKGVKIQNNVSIYEGVVLEDYTFCGPSMVFTNVKTPRSKFPVSNQTYSETRVKYGASIGANATIVCGTTVGKWALVAAGAVVTKDVPSYALIAGVPAKRIGWVCGCGIRLSLKEDKAACSCKRHYHLESAENLVQTEGPEL